MYTWQQWLMLAITITPALIFAYVLLAADFHWWPWNKIDEDY